MKEKKTMYKFKTKPWAHQLMALDYLYPRDVAALYTDMGTGKTKIMIDLIVNRGFKFVLICCTNKGCAVWEKQISIHSDIRSEMVLNLAGVSSEEKVSRLTEKASRLKFVQESDPLIVIVNYEGVWREPFANTLLKLGCKGLIDAVICDESHRIKSPSSKCSWFLKSIGNKVKHRYLVTGTPLAENPMDIYAQYRFLDPTIFGTRFNDFKARYQNLDVQKSARVGFPVLDKNTPYVNLDELQEKMFSCAFMAKSSVELPKRLNIVKTFQLGKKAARAYDEVTKEGVLIEKAGTLEISSVLTLSIRQQQLTSGFVPLETDDKQKIIKRLDRSRIEELQELLDGLGEEPVVVFARFRSDLTQIRKLCKEMDIGYSELSGKHDDHDIWLEGKTQVLGVQYTSGSESVDLTRAHYCVYYSLTNSLALYLQSKKRIHRPGQTKPVIYYYLVADIGKKGSIDRTILEALQKKKDVTEYILQKGFQE